MTPDKSPEIRYNEAAFRVCVDRHEDGRLSGRVTGMRLTAPIAFEDFSAFFTQVDKVLDAQNLPQAFMKKRQFKSVSKKAPPPPPAEERPRMTQEEVEASWGALTTFTVRITSRQNASWQGHVVWQDDDSIVRFRSALELAKLVQAYMEGNH